MNRGSARETAAWTGFTEIAINYCIFDHDRKVQNAFLN